MPFSRNPLDVGGASHEEVLVGVGHLPQVIPHGLDTGQFSALGGSDQPEISSEVHGLRQHRHQHLYGPDAARFYTKIKTVSQRWPQPDAQAAPVSLAFNPKA